MERLYPAIPKFRQDERGHGVAANARPRLEQTRALLRSIVSYSFRKIDIVFSLQIRFVFPQYHYIGAHLTMRRSKLTFPPNFACDTGAWLWRLGSGVPLFSRAECRLTRRLVRPKLPHHSYART